MRKKTRLLFFSLCVMAFVNFMASEKSFANEVKKHALNESISIIDAKSDFETVYNKVLELVKEKNLTVFAEFDHAQNAKEVNLDLPSNKVIVFGNPAVGTKLMQLNPQTGLSLPLKMLIAENKDGKVQIVYERLPKLFAGYGIYNNEIIMRIERLMLDIAQKAAQ